MDAKLKAKELRDKFILNLPTSIEKARAKSCALITVNEIIENIKEWDFMNDNGEHHLWFWNNVKKEISTL